MCEWLLPIYDAFYSVMSWPVSMVNLFIDFGRWEAMVLSIMLELFVTIPLIIALYKFSEEYAEKVFGIFFALILLTNAPYIILQLSCS